MKNKINIAINGFGRIGRAIMRLNIKHERFNIVAINDIDADINNLAYLLKYDSTYGKLQNTKIDVDTITNSLIIGSNKIPIYNNKNIDEIPWDIHNVDIVIDSSGVQHNVLNSKKLITKGIKKVIITHSPKLGIDFTFIHGVNDEKYNIDLHNIISSSICDANAVAPFYKIINDEFGIESGDITTLHPWLSYQNLLDGTIKSVSSPGHQWNDYALGRSSISSLIPKETTLCNALDNVFPGFSQNIFATSFRTPTSIVSAANGIFLLKKETTIEKINEAIIKFTNKFPNVLLSDSRSLISIDYLMDEHAAVIDTRFLKLNKNNLLKFVLWYDNEWGYSFRTYNLISKIL